MKIVVIGGSGLPGSRVVQKFLAKLSPTHTRDTTARRSRSERYSPAKTPDLAKHVSTPGSSSPQPSQLRRKQPEAMVDNEFRIGEVSNP
jgi:hypothetical protein